MVQRSPPPVEEGEAPIHIKIVNNKLVDGCKMFKSTVANPAFLADVV